MGFSYTVRLCAIDRLAFRYIPIETQVTRRVPKKAPGIKCELGFLSHDFLARLYSSVASLLLPRRIGYFSVRKKRGT